MDPRQESMELAQVNGDVTSEARDRLAKRLTNDRKPSTAASTGTWVDWSSESQFLGQPWDSTKIPLSKLEQMRRDPIIAFGLMFCKVPLVKAPWYIKCADPKIAAAVDSSLRKIYGRFILAYTNAFDYGFSPMVKRFEYEDNPDWTYIDNTDPFAEERPVWTDKSIKPIVWKPFTALNPRLAQPHWNSKGEFNGIDFNAKWGMGGFGTSGWPWSVADGSPFPNNAGRIADIPLDWALWATNEKDSSFASIWGYPRIGYAYRFWWEYLYRFGVSSRAFERWGDPPVVVYHPNDPTAIDPETGDPVNYSAEAISIAEKFRSGANISLPASVVTSVDERPSSIREWEVVQLESKVNFDSINKIFEYLDVQKLRAVLVPEQALVEGKGGTSSRNVASTLGDLFQESLAVVKTEIDDHLNRYVIPQFVELNFGTDAPKASIVTNGFDPVDIETARQIVQLIGQEDGLDIIDQRKLFEQLGAPVRTQKELNILVENKKQEALKIAEASKPAPVPARPGQAGLSEDGVYFQGREKIVIYAQDDTLTADKMDQLFEKVKEVERQTQTMNEKDPVVNVTVVNQNTKTETEYELERDEEGRLTRIVKSEKEESDEE